MDQFEKELAHVSEQGSEIWHDMRAGRWTASEIHRLMKSGQRPMTKEELDARPKKGVGSKTMWVEDPTAISDDTLTYIREKVAETLTGQAKGQVFSMPTQHGEEMEPWAADWFAARYQFDLEDVSFVPYGESAGGSPDRIVYKRATETTERGKKSILEIKAPFDSAKQIGYLELTDPFDLKREHPDYYWQCMANMLFTDTEVCHFVTFDHRMTDDRYKMAYIKIPRNESECDLIKKKIEAADKLKKEMIETLDKIIAINERSNA